MRLNIGDESQNYRIISIGAATAKSNNYFLTNGKRKKVWVDANINFEFEGHFQGSNCQNWYFGIFMHLDHCH